MTTIVRKKFQSIASCGLTWVIVLPLLLNLPIILGLLQTDSIVRFSGLAAHVVPGVLAGAPLEDPSMGFTYEPNAKLAMQQIAGGHMPWWNSFEGTGMPLAGEMQSAAFSIFSPLMFLRNGQALINLCVELLSGVGLYLLLRRLRFSDFAAAVGGLAFSLNGSYAWLGAEMFYAAAFLPLLLYRLECLRESAAPHFGNWFWIAVLVALPVSCGFPETVFYDDLFVIAWIVVRSFGLEKNARLFWVANAAIGGALGVLLVSPLLIAFFDFLRVAYVGEHGGSFGDKILPHETILQTFMPYVWGPISNFVNNGPLFELQQMWPNVGGYLGLASTLVALLAIRGERLRSLRFLAVAWLVVFLAAGFGAQPFHALVMLIPGAKYTSYFRYSPPTWELCAAFLIAATIDDAVRSARRFSFKQVAVLCSASIVALTALALSSSGDFHELFDFPQYASWIEFAIISALTAIVGVLFASQVSSGRIRGVLLGSLVVAEASLFLFIPILANFRSADLDERGVSFIQSRIGLQRVYTLGPLDPNTGSAFGIAQITYNDAPIPDNLHTFVGQSLDQAVNPILFTGTDVPGPGMPTRLDMFKRNMSNFAAAGVSYVLAAPHAAEHVYDIGQQTLDARALDVFPKSHVSIRSTAIATSGLLRAISIPQGNYNDTATGDLIVRVCVRVGCSQGRRPLAQSKDNQYFEVALDHPILVGHEPLQVDVTSTGTKPDGLWSYGDVGAQSMTMTYAGQSVLGRHLVVRLSFASFSYADPASPTDNTALQMKAGVPVKQTIAAMPPGDIAAMSILIGNFAGSADGRMRITVCTVSHCERAERSTNSSIDDAMFDFTFPHPLHVSDGKILLRYEVIGGRRPPALWLFPASPYGSQIVTSATGDAIAGRSLQSSFVYTSGFGLRSVYDDDRMSIYQVPNVRSYYSAPFCTVRARDRDDAEADCSSPTTLVRLETFMPGWHAIVNGATAPISLDNTLFQSITLAAGHSTIRFEFQPPYIEAGYALFMFTLAILVAEALANRVRLRR